MTARAAIGGVSAACLAAALLAAPVPEAADTAATGQVSAGLVAVLEQVTDGAADAAARAVADQAGLIAGGDTCFARHGASGAAGGLPREARRALALATAARSGPTKTAAFAALRESYPDGAMGWRIALEQASYALRSGAPAAEAEAALAAAAAMDGVPDTCRADEAFLRAQLASGPERRRRLGEAVAADPAYWQAQAQLAAVLVAQDPRLDCTDDVATLISTLVALRRLTATTRDRVRLANRIEDAARTTASPARLALMRGMFAELDGAQAVAADRYREALAASAQDRCATDLAHAAETLLAGPKDKT